MSKKIFGQLINFILFCGYGVFCWYYSYLKPGYASLNVFLEILKFLGIFAAALAGSAIIHRLGHIFFALFQGLAILNNSFFSKSVRIRLKNTFDTAPAFKKNGVKYSRFLLGGLMFNTAVILAAVVIYALCLASRTVFSPLVVVSLAAMISCWYFVYAAFSDSPARRGDFISYQRSRNSDSLAITLAAQSAAEELDNVFILTEAQKALVLRIEHGVDLDKEAMSALSAVFLYARNGKIALDPVIENYSDIQA